MSQARNKRVLTGTHFMLGNFAVVEGALAAGCDLLPDLGAGYLLYARGEELLPVTFEGKGVLP